MKQQSSTSVVILNWNGVHYLKKFLPVLIKSVKKTPETKIVVADNGSTDNSIQLLKEEFSSVEIITLDKNYGFAEGYNKALALIDSDYYVLLNSDVEVSENWLNTLVEYMDENCDVVACQPKILSYLDRNRFEYAGAAGGFIDKYGYPFCRGRIFGELEEDKGQYDAIIDVFWASGACLMIRSKDYWEVGGLDKDFFAHQEEIDLCWRLKSRGKRIVCNPQSVVFHIGGGTLQAESPQKTYLNFRNNLLMIYKNMPDKELNKILSIRCLLDYLAAFHLLLQGKFSNFKAVLKARSDFQKLKSNFTEKRNENIQYSVQISTPKCRTKNLLVEFYLKGNKTFNKVLN